MCNPKTFTNEITNIITTPISKNLIFKKLNINKYTNKVKQSAKFIQLITLLTLYTLL